MWGDNRNRVAIARAIATEPLLIVCDEPVSALDVSVQAQVLELFQTLRAQSGISYLFITHDLTVVRQVADRLYVLRAGRVVEEGVTADVIGRPTEPYTIELLRATPGNWGYAPSHPAPVTAAELSS